VEPGLIAGRDCAGCNVCCVALTINDPALKKPQGYRCRNARPDNSCAIYETRPQTCRSFECGWRRFRWIRETLRPDRSGVLVRQHNVAAADGSVQHGVIFMLLNRAALKAEGLAESVAAAIAASIPVFLNIPGPPGYTSAVARMNDVLADAVMLRDKAAVLEIVRRTAALGRAGKFQAIDLSRDA